MNQGTIPRQPVWVDVHYTFKGKSQGRHHEQSDDGTSSARWRVSIEDARGKNFPAEGIVRWSTSGEKLSEGAAAGLWCWSRWEGLVPRGGVCSAGEAGGSILRIHGRESSPEWYWVWRKNNPPRVHQVSQVNSVITPTCPFSLDYQRPWAQPSNTYIVLRSQVSEARSRLPPLPTGDSWGIVG